MLELKANMTPLCSFARGIGISEEVAIAMYEAEFQRLSAHARIARYVAVIAEKRTKDRLKARARGSPAAIGQV